MLIYLQNMHILVPVSNKQKKGRIFNPAQWFLNKNL